MNKQKTLALGILASLFITFSIIGCKKDSTDSDVQTAQDNSLAESNYDDVTTMVDASANSGGTITWVSTRQREWVEGYSTPLNVLDDTYSITGSASGTRANGESYTITITQALVRKMSCYWFESGKVEITPAGKLTRTLDY